MRILVVSGFLGAGKTTFIQQLARRSGRDFVVYENEYGQADIDAKMLSETEELSVWESTENCICCSGKQDFATSILTIANTLDPEYLVVEPTGVARLSSVIENIELVKYDQISILEPLVIVDATAWVRQRQRFEDIYLDQIKTASVVVLSKVQHTAAGELSELVEWVKYNNPDADVSDISWDQLSNEWLIHLLEHDLDPEAARRHKAARKEIQEDEFESLSLANIELPTENHLIWFLDALVAGVFGEVVRAKGYLSCGSQWLRFDVVDRAWSITGYEPEESSESVGVFIGPSIKRSWLREALLPLVREAVLEGYAQAGQDESSDYDKVHHRKDCDCEHAGPCKHDHMHNYDHADSPEHSHQTGPAGHGHGHSHA